MGYVQLYESLWLYGYYLDQTYNTTANFSSSRNNSILLSQMGNNGVDGRPFASWIIPTF